MKSHIFAIVILFFTNKVILAETNLNMPEGCSNEDCLFEISWSKYSDYTDFVIKSKISDNLNSNSLWIGLGLSYDNEMVELKV